MSKFIKGQTSWNKNISHSEETKRKISERNKRQHFSPKTEFKKKDIRLMGHKPYGGLQTRFKQGKDHPNWKGGITPIRKKLYFSKEYKFWRKSIFERDNYICVWCGQKSGKLNADHVKPWCDYPELRFAIDNGRSLCESCHKKTDTYAKNKLYGLLR